MRASAARLLLLNGAGAYRRLAGIAAGVALGVGMLLILLGGFLHMPDRDDRIAWRTYGGEGLTYVGADPQVPAATPQTALRDKVADYFLGQPYSMVLVAASADTALTLPDGTALPGPGEYYASAAMAEEIAAHPADQLAERFGTLVGELPPTSLKGPSELVVLVGSDWDELAQVPETDLVTEFPDSGSRFSAGLYRFILAVGSVAVLVPIVLLISIVSQLGASERRERFATVRLIGAGRRAIAALSGLEMLVASLAGAVAGVGVAAALRPLASTMSLNGSTSYAADLTPSWGWTAVAVVAVSLLGGATAWWRTYRDDVGALGATRERAEKPVTWLRSLTLAIGLAMLVGPALVFYGDKGAPEVFMFVMLAGFAVTAFGIVVAGPWLTRVTSRIVAASARTAPTVVAAGRLSRHPRSTFRSVAGLVVAVFIVSLFAGVVSAVEQVATPHDTPGRLTMDAVMSGVGSTSEAEAVVAALNGAEGVERVVLAYESPDDDWRDVMAPDDARAIGAIDVPDASAVRVDMFEMLAGELVGSTEAMPAPEASDVSLAGLDASRVIAITDGSAAAKERARTAMERAGLPGLAPVTRADYAAGATLTLTHELEAMAYLGMAIAIGISALSLTVATVAGALDRKRTFALLRLGGMPSGHLRRVIATEAAVPLAATLAMSAGLGFFVAWVMLVSLGNELTMRAPDAQYWLAIAASVAIAAVAIVGSFGMVRRSTEVTSTRFE